MQAAAERDLILLSQFAGHDVLLAQGGGGNTSVKSADGARMWIKASGLRLSEVGPGAGYLETDLPALLRALGDGALAALPRVQAHVESVERIQAAVRGGGPLRPSLETTFHASLGRRVLHTHPVYLNAFACMAGGEAALAEAVGEPGLWVRYEPPGFALGLAVARAVEGYRAAEGGLPGHVILQNHGLIASAAEADEAIETTRRFAQAGERYFGRLDEEACAFSSPPPALARWAEGLQAALDRRRPGLIVQAARRKALLGAGGDEAWGDGLPLAPDDVVYNGPRLYWAEATGSPAAWLDREFGELPERLAVWARGLGAVLAGPNGRTLEAMEENLLAHSLIRRLIAGRGGQARPLPPEETAYLQAMESEKYRQRIVAR